MSVPPAYQKPQNSRCETAFSAAILKMGSRSAVNLRPHEGLIAAQPLAVARELDAKSKIRFVSQ
jgi:hypothetical protein